MTRTKASRLALWLVFGVTLSQAAMADPTCTQTAGAQKAHRLVEQCLDVSPATHPPCNAANSCSVIEAEIRRGCDFVGKDAPTFCAQYRQSNNAGADAGSRKHTLKLCAHRQFDLAPSRPATLATAEMLL